MKALIKVNGSIRVVQVTDMFKSTYVYYWGGDKSVTQFYNLKLVKDTNEVDHSHKDCVELVTPSASYLFSIEEMDQYEWFIRELYETDRVDLTQFTCKNAKSFER